MKKIYISVPISGRNIEDVESDIIFASAQIEKHGCKAVSPLEVSPNPDASYEEHIGNDMTELLRCDAILLLDNWQQSKGCLLENQAALLYGKNQYYGIDDFVNKINKKKYKESDWRNPPKLKRMKTMNIATTQVVR